MACIAMVILAAYAGFDPSDRRRSPRPLFFLIFAPADAMTALERIAEYWPPFAIIFAAFALQPWVAGPGHPSVQLPPTRRIATLPGPARPSVMDLERPITASYCSLVPPPLSLSCAGLRWLPTLLVTIKDYQRQRSAKPLQSRHAMGAFKCSTRRGRFQHRLGRLSPGCSITNSDSRLCFRRRPRFAYDRNAELSKLYDRITLGKRKIRAAPVRDRFGARYVLYRLTPNTHSKFSSKAMDSGWFEGSLYEDKGLHHPAHSRVSEERKATSGSN